MDYKCLVLLLCLSGAAAQQMVGFPQNPVGGTVGESILLTCGFSGRNGDTMSWSRVDLLQETSITVYDSKSDSAESGYSIQKSTDGDVEYFNLQIDPAKRELAGFYKCECLPVSDDVAVLIFDPPNFMDDDDDDHLVEGIDTTFTCDVTYGSPDTGELDQTVFTVQMEDWQGNALPEYNTTDTSVADGFQDVTQTQRMRTVYSNPVQLDWEDDGQDYACVIRMDGGYEKNSTLTLSVRHKASNASLDPHDPDMTYVRNEDVTVVYSSNPYPAKEFRWYRELSPGNWELVDGEEDNDATITINGDWPDSTTLKVEIINAFDHDADGLETDQMANYTFPMTLSDSCGGSGASMLITTLFALLATFFLQR